MVLDNCVASFPYCCSMHISVSSMSVYTHNCTNLYNIPYSVIVNTMMFLSFCLVNLVGDTVHLLTCFFIGYNFKFSVKVETTIDFIKLFIFYSMFYYLFAYRLYKRS